MRFSDYKPRHVLCLLAPKGNFVRLYGAVRKGIDDFAPGFEIDTQFSQDEPDDRMEDSFQVSWDRVYPDAWIEEDENAVLDHGCVIYVLGPHMDPENSVEISTRALRLAVHALANGATAVKGESAGVAHGVARWRQLGRDAEEQSADMALARICRLAFGKRPLSENGYLSSVGFHLVGLPDVFVSASLGKDDHALSMLIDRIADEMFRDGVDAVLAAYRATLLPVQDYDEDDFKYNPYGEVHLTDVAAPQKPN